MEIFEGAFFVYSFNGDQYCIGQVINGLHCDSNERELSSMCNYNNCSYYDTKEDAQKEVNHLAEIAGTYY